MLWERAKATADGRTWLSVAKQMAASLDKTWPAGLCTQEESSLCAVTLTVSALKHRFQKLSKGKVTAGAARARAIHIIGMTQIYLPPESMSLWSYFRAAENMLVNKGSLAQKERRLGKAQRTAKRNRKHASKMHEMVLDAYGLVRQDIITARQTAYGAAQNPQESPKSNRKRAHQRSSQDAVSQRPVADRDLPLPAADSSPQNSPPAKESRVHAPVDQMSPSAPHAQASGRRMRSM